MTDGELEAHFARLHQRLDQLEERLVEPLVLSRKAAARRLGIGLTKLRQLVHARKIRTTLLGGEGQPMISMRELERVASPSQPESRRAQPEPLRARTWQPIPKKNRAGMQDREVLEAELRARLKR